jgi:glycerol uptake facilitator-like aquaporin
MDDRRGKRDALRLLLPLSMCFYFIAQLMGGIVAAFLLWGIFGRLTDGLTIPHTSLRKRKRRSMVEAPFLDLLVYG